MLWACLHLPRLALDAVAGADVGNAPHAIVDGPPQRRHVVVANAAATACGLRGGHSLAAAQMLCPQLATTARDEATERQALETLAAWAYRFSADIHVGAAEISIEVGASLALFGGWPALQRRLRHELAAFDIGFMLAAAPTPGAARVFATHADGIAITSAGPLVHALGAVPITGSGLAVKTIAALDGMGFRKLRDLFALPRAELTRRIGEEALDHLDRMRGLKPETLPRWRPPDRFERRIEFAFGIEAQAALAFPLQRLIREFALFLIARDGGVQRFRLILGHERGASTRIEIGLLAPQRDPASLIELARARLERIALAAPVHALTLVADDLPPLCPLHRDLFEARRADEQEWPVLAERLRARLGERALRGLRCVADHRPGRAWDFVAVDALERHLHNTGALDKTVAAKPLGDRAASTRSAAAIVQTTPPRPFWLLRRPLAMREPPARILAGPERIESGWWDEHDYRRDYYIVATRQGQRAWAYVEAGTHDHWTLHGWFA